MKSVYLNHATLKNYRNFSELSIEFKQGINIIIGSNGSGKSNILESISFLSPGKGIKSANFDEVSRYGLSKWASQFDLQSKLGVAELALVYNSTENTRQIQYNGSKISVSELSNLLTLIWLTPQMEGIFLDSSSARRKFFDRIVYNFYIDHAKNIAKYQYYMRERNKCLANNDLNSAASLLSILEQHMAKEAFKISLARSKTIKLMQESIDNLNTEFPKAKLSISSLFESEDEFENFEANYLDHLAKARKKDIYSGRTSFGVHKIDLNVFHQDKQRHAKLCSTGEQKALLVSIVLASIESVIKNTQTTPILLLDELFVHLDDIRKKHLALYIMQNKLQTFITSTDIIGIEDLISKAHIIKL